MEFFKALFFSIQKAAEEERKASGIPPDKDKENSQPAEDVAITADELLT